MRVACQMAGSARPENINYGIDTMKKYLILSLLFACTSTVIIQAQSAEIGIMGGVSLYGGDMSPNDLNGYMNELNPAFGAFARFNLNRALSLRAGISQAKVTGADINTDYPERMRNFRSNITEFALTMEFVPFNWGDTRSKVVTSPYLFGGAAVYRFNPQALYNNDWVDLQPLGTEGQGLAGYEAPYSLTQFAVLFGLGVKFTFNQAWAIGLEFGARKLFNDYLDDITSAEVNYLDVLTGNGTIAAELSNPTIKEPQDVTYVRGGDFNDWYGIGSVTLSFRLQGRKNRLGRGLGCPDF